MVRLIEERQECPGSRREIPAVKIRDSQLDRAEWNLVKRSKFRNDLTYPFFYSTIAFTIISEIS